YSSYIIITPTPTSIIFPYTTLFRSGFEEQLVGVKAGEEKDVTVTFPEEYHAEDLAGKEAIIKTKVHEIKGKELPELNDDFAKETDEQVETLDELKAAIRTRLEETKKNEAEQTVRNSAVDQAAENATIDIPEIMISN